MIKIRGVFANLRVTFKLLLLGSDTTSIILVGFSFQVQLMFSIFVLKTLVALERKNLH